MDRINWSRAAHIIFCVVSITALAYIFIRYALIVFLPFVIAWIFAVALYPLSNKISKHFKISKKICSFVLMLLFYVIFGFIIWMSINRLVYECQKLLIYADREKESILASIKTFFGKVSDLKTKIPLIDGLFEMEELGFLDDFDSMTTTFFSNTIRNISEAIPQLVTKIITSTPKVLFFIIVTLAASFYFAVGLDDIHNGIIKCLPVNLANKLRKIKNGFFVTAIKYLKAYSLLMLITFCELFIGLSVLSVDYAFILALVISLIDILPVFGTGTVLVPWAVVSFFLKDFKLGIGLLVIYGVIVVVRQFVEPKIVGRSLGLHPLLTLCAIYVGFRLFGVLGMLIGPVVVLFVKQVLYASKKEDNSK